MITPYENVTGGDPRFMHFYEMDTDDPEGAFQAMTPRVIERLGGRLRGTRRFDAWAFHDALRIMYVNTFRRLGRAGRRLSLFEIVFAVCNGACRAFRSDDVGDEVDRAGYSRPRPSRPARRTVSRGSSSWCATTGVRFAHRRADPSGVARRARAPSEPPAEPAAARRRGPRRRRRCRVARRCWWSCAATSTAATKPHCPRRSSLRCRTCCWPPTRSAGRGSHHAADGVPRPRCAAAGAASSAVRRRSAPLPWSRLGCPAGPRPPRREPVSDHAHRDRYGEGW